MALVVHSRRHGDRRRRCDGGLHGERVAGQRAGAARRGRKPLLAGLAVSVGADEGQSEQTMLGRRSRFGVEPARPGCLVSGPSEQAVFPASERDERGPRFPGRRAGGRTCACSARPTSWGRKALPREDAFPACGAARELGARPGWRLGIAAADSERAGRGRRGADDRVGVARSPRSGYCGSAEAGGVASEGGATRKRSQAASSATPW